MNGLYKTDKNMQFQKSQDNPTVIECYEKFLDGKPNSHKAHELLHTGYENRDSVFDAPLSGPERVRSEMRFPGGLRDSCE